MKHGTYTIPISGGTAAWIVDYFWKEGEKATATDPPVPGRLESYSIHARFADGSEQEMTDHIDEVRALVQMDFGRVFDAIYTREECQP